MTAFLKDVIGYGTHAARPAAGSAGALYFESDRGRLFRDNGTTWDALDPFTTAGDMAYFDGTNVARLAAGATGYELTESSSTPTWAAEAGGGGGGSLTTVSNALSADVSMPSANTYYDGPSVSCAAGTWLLIGAVTCSNSGSQTDFTAKLWDGTTAYASAQSAPRASGTTQDCSLSVGWIVTPSSTTTYKISAAGDNASSIIMAAAGRNAAGNTASWLVGVKVA